jgi:cell division GTPase FtsZ
MAKFSENGIDWADLTAAFKGAKKISMIDGADMTLDAIANKIKGASGLIINIQHIMTDKEGSRKMHTEIIRFLESQAGKKANVIWGLHEGNKSKIMILAGW